MKTALITGATSGIGKEMAIYLHSKGWRLVLTGRNREALHRMAKAFGSTTRTLALDLAEQGAAEKLYDFCKGTRIDFLINNAGFGVFGSFTDAPLENELELIDVNIRALHILTKLFLRDMTARDSGVILNVGSVAGFTTGPMLSSYYASKNYVVRLTEAIHEELRQAGSPVKVSCLCPGPVDTAFNDNSGVLVSGKQITAKQAAREGVDGALRGKMIVIPGTKMKMVTIGSHLLGEHLSTRINYRIQKKKAGE